MEYEIFIKRLQGRIAGMSFSDRTLLAIEICKRLFPDYMSFHRSHQWGDPGLLLDGISTCEAWLTGTTDHAKVNDLIQRIDTVVPDTEDFGGYDGSFALNAGAAVELSLQHLMDQDAAHIVDVATLYTDTIDFKLSESGMHDDRKMDNHPKMVEARRFLLGE